MSSTSTASGDLEARLAEVRHQVYRAELLAGSDFDPLALEVTLLLYRLVGEYTRLHTAELAPHGLAVDQFNVLTVLRRSDAAMTMSQVSRAVSVRPARLTTVVDRLCERDLVARKANPLDRRSLHLILTQRGRELLEAILPRHWVMLGDLIAGLGNDERLELVQVLRRWLVSAAAAPTHVAAPPNEPVAMNGPTNRQVEVAQ